MQNSDRENALRAIPVSFISRIFNITPSQWPRVGECWFITFFFKIGAAIGATILTSAFIARFGIVYLPVLLLIGAVFIIVSTVFFEQLIMKVKREVLMMVMLFAASMLIFAATFFYDSSPYIFFTFTILAEAIFLAQFNIFIPILVGDRFTPLESQSTFPFVESGETIGGIVGASLLAFFGTRLPVTWFMYMWIGFLICAVIVFIITSYVRTSLPKLPIHPATATNSEEKYELKNVFTSIKKMPFLKSLVIIVLMQWVFMNFLDFQFTKSVEQSVLKSPEATMVRIDNFSSLKASSLMADVIPAKVNTENLSRKLTHEQEAMLSEKLGKIRSSFHVAALVVQALIATRLIASLGVIGSMLLHPIIMLMSLVGLFLKFGVVSSTISRMNFEITNVVYKNAYFASHYALPKSIRDQGAQFLEGIARPVGTIIGMSAILVVQLFFSGKDLSMFIHILMACIMFGVLYATLKLQSKYTDITREQLFSQLPYPEKLNAIEILAQKGHKDAATILSEKLSCSGQFEETSIVRVKILYALGVFSDYRTLPEILDALSDNNPEVRLGAANALMNFKNVGDKFYSQAFSRFRMIEVLKETLKKEKFQSVRSAIIRVFSILRQSEIIPFLLEQLRNPDSRTRADCIHTIGLFKDPNTVYYILPALEDPDRKVRAVAIVALWQFTKYLPMLETKLKELAESSDVEDIRSAFYIMGEVDHPNNHELHSYLKNENPEIALEAAFALTKCGEVNGFIHILDHLLKLPDDEFDSVRLFIGRLKPSAKEMINRVIIHVISSEINRLIHSKNINSVDDIPTDILNMLRRCYVLIEQHEELFEFENELCRRMNNAIQTTISPI